MNIRKNLNPDNALTDANAPSGLASAVCSPCDCRDWASIEPYKTNHHPNCKRVDESLIDIWHICLKGEKYGYFTKCGMEANECDHDDDYTVTERKIHEEIFDRLPEHAGF